jgi:putative ABC transport system permease protein
MMDRLRQFFRRLAAPFRSTQAEHELAREIRSHLRLLEDRFLAEGMSPDEARFAAQRAFGGVEQAKEHQRDARSFRWIDDSRIDFKLGARMLVKYPGLSLVGGFGLAAAIAIGMSAFAFFYAYIYAPLPLDEGDRVVGVEHWNVEVNNEEQRALHDFVEWRQDLRTVQDLSAFRTIGRNLIVPGGVNEPVQIAEITASAFTLVRTSPLLGRGLVTDDERIGAPPVVVIGYDVWQSRFGASPDVIGRDVRLGNTVHTIVGVMPDGFKFPVNHSYWTPLRIDLSAFGRRQGPAVFIFGRLAPRVTLADAQAELRTIGDRASKQFPETHATLEPRVMPYAHPIMDIQGITAWQFATMQATMSVLLFVVAINLGILVYARTATRHGEIAIRTALGATRRRIVGQLFIESLVLSGIAAAVGLLLSRYGMRVGHQIMQMEGPGATPYWIDFGIPAAAYGYLILATLLAAVISGVIPALRATGSQVQNTLRELGGSSGLQLGRTWTLLIVVQVALTVAGLPMAISMGWGEARGATTRPAFAAERFIVAPFRLDPEPPPATNAAEYQRDVATRFQKLHSDFAARVEAEPEVSDVTMSWAIPGNEPEQRIELEQGELASAAPTVSVNRIAGDFFDAFDAPMLIGRRLTPGDITSNAVVVNRAFVQRVLGDGPALGRRIRYRDANAASQTVPAPQGEWHEIVGVVADLQINRADPSLVDPVVFHMLDVSEATTLTLIVRTRGADAAALVPRLRDIAVALDPTVRITPRPMLELYRQMDLAFQLMALAIGLIIISVMLLAAAGIYALMSFTVSQRRKEIGIRAAMGADARRLLISVFSRAAGQLGAGVAAGLALAVGLDVATSGDALGSAGLTVLPVIAVAMVVVGLLAALGPARRGLHIHPTEALREP